MSQHKCVCEMRTRQNCCGKNYARTTSSILVSLTRSLGDHKQHTNVEWTENKHQHTLQTVFTEVSVYGNVYFCACVYLWRSLTVCQGGCGGQYIGAPFFQTMQTFPSSGWDLFF